MFRNELLVGSNPNPINGLKFSGGDFFKQFTLLHKKNPYADWYRSLYTYGPEMAEHFKETKSKLITAIGPKAFASKNWKLVATS